MLDQANCDKAEIIKFSLLANDWWNPFGHCKPLHKINPLRMDFIQRYTSLEDKQILDVGCGGGILTESLAKSGCIITGIDLSVEALEVARVHAQNQNLSISYESTSVEEFAQKKPGHFDVITCMELLEHVPNPASVIQACAELLKPGGQLFLSTINRNPKAYFFAILAAEYFLKLLPRGTHQYAKFIKPIELLEMVEATGMTFAHTQGIHYQPVTQNFQLVRDISVNYLVHCCKDK